MPRSSAPCLEFTYHFVPGSKMAKQFAAYGEPQTNFAGFLKPMPPPR